MFKNKLITVTLFALMFFNCIMLAIGDVTFYGDTTLYLKDGDIEVTFVDTGISMEYCEYDTGNNYILLENINLTTTTEDEVHIQVSELDSSGSNINVGDTVLRYNATVWGKNSVVDESEDVVSASGDTGDVTDIAKMYDENYNTGGYLLASGTDKTVSIYEYYNNVPNNVTNIVFYAKTIFTQTDVTTSFFSLYAYNYLNSTWDEMINKSLTTVLGDYETPTYTPSYQLNDTDHYISSNQVRTKIMIDIQANPDGNTYIHYYDSRITYYNPMNSTTVFNFTGNITGNRAYDLYKNSILTTSNIASNSFDITMTTADKTEYEIRFADFYPDPPYDGSSSYNSSNVLNLSWTPGNYSDKEIVVYNANGYPSSPTDGTEVYNYTDDFYNFTTFTSGYYTVWSYNSSYNVFSLTGLDIPWGAIGVTVYNESNFAEAISPFGLLISDSDGSNTYYNSSCTGTHYLDMLLIPYGDNTIIKINSTNYKDRTYYKDLSTNSFYNFTFYLPPVTTPVDPGSGDDGGNETTTRLYYVRVLDERGLVVEDALVVVNRYNNETDNYVEVASGLTDAYGSCSFQLIPNVLYKVNISKSGYTTNVGNDWEPDPDKYGIEFAKPFEIKFVQGGTNITTVGDCISFNATINAAGTITVYYTDICESTTNTAIYIYEYYNGSLTLNSTDSRTGENSFSFTSAGYNTSQLHRLYLYVNHSRFGFEILTYDIDPLRDKADLDVLEERFDNVFGNFDLGWIKFFIIFVPCIFMLVVFGTGHSGLGVLASGLYMGFTGIMLDMGNISIYSTLASILAVVGIVLIIIKKGRKAI